MEPDLRRFANQSNKDFKPRVSSLFAILFLMQVGNMVSRLAAR
ncbi:hypothetical protein RintRC_4051 [Richelia intracellularis]|nr:hypothetical protein RintRC_4051 [Richelia intracellularis]